MATTRDGRKGRYSAEVLENTPVASGHVLLRLRCPEVVGSARPGQFLQVRVTGVGQDPLLRRPICVAYAAGDEMEILVRRAGRGTDLLACEQPGGLVDLLGPLGHGFTMPAPAERVALVGGRVGIAPLQFLFAAVEAPDRVTVLLGGRSADQLPRLPRLAECAQLRIATDDGSEGFHGHVVHCLADWLSANTVDRIYGCGPRAMLVALAQLTMARKIPCEVSVEERMACGFGVCMGCSVPMVSGGYKRACTEGPVFDVTEVRWE